MELICPSCEARYGIPDGSIGEKGRQVSCMNCGHSWHAYPPLVLGAAQAAGSAAAGMQWRDPAGGASAPAWEDGAARAAPEPTAVPPVAPSVVSTPSPSAGAFAAATGVSVAKVADAGATASTRAATSRSEQLMEIRETLAEIQSEDRAASARPELTGEETPSLSAVEPNAEGARADTFADRARERTRVLDETSFQKEAPADKAEEEVDLLRRRLEQSGEREKVKPADVRRMRKRHDRKARARNSNAAAGSGAFLTGFLLVAIIASVLISLYLLAPQISERMPAAEQPLNEYVATVDGLRVSIAETWQSVSGWVSESLEGKV